MKILLTGADGFIGKHLQSKLLDHNVIYISRGNTLKNYKYFKKNISSKESYADCLRGVDVIIHMAARVHKMNDFSKNLSENYMETNCFSKN